MGVAEAGREMMRIRGLGRPFAPDAHADRAGRDVELLDLHHHRAHALVRQHAGGEPLRHGLHEFDMAARQDHFDRVHDHVIGEDAAHVVGARDPRDLDIDVEAHALRMSVLVPIGADGDRQDEIAHDA